MFYKVVLNGSYQGQKINNMLYYRSGLGFNAAEHIFGGAEIVANNVEQEIWATNLVAIMPTTYTLNTITVYVLDDNFALYFSLPYTKTVAVNGNYNAAMLPPSSCMNYRFNLEPLVGPNVLLGPRRGYVAIGPIAEALVGDNGFLDSPSINNVLGNHYQLGVRLSSNLEELTPPLTFYPIRVRVIRNPITGGVLWTGYADIKGFSIDPVASWRRSRKPGVGQ